MRMHSRFSVVQAAERDLREALSETWRKHDLTDAEMLGVVAEVLGGHVHAYAKYAIRQERHGDASKPGDLA